LERRALLEELELESRHVRLVETFQDGEALFAAVCALGLEGVVAKRLRDPYRPGERQWVKTKNRATARFAEERDRSQRGRASGPNLTRGLGQAVRGGPAVALLITSGAWIAICCIQHR